MEDRRSQIRCVSSIFYLLSSILNPLSSKLEKEVHMATIGRDTTITWLGHGTFRITTPGGKKLLIDAWVDSNPACPDEWKQRVHTEGLDAIFVPHGHFDHIS